MDYKFIGIDDMTNRLIVIFEGISDKDSPRITDYKCITFDRKTNIVNSRNISSIFEFHNRNGNIQKAIFGYRLSDIDELNRISPFFKDEVEQILAIDNLKG